MKKLIAVIIILGVLGGGGAGALWYFKLPPFKKSKTPSAKPAAAVVAADSVEKKDSPVPAETAEYEKKTETPQVKPDFDGISLKATPPPPDFTEEGVSRLAAIYSQMPINTVKEYLPKLPDSVIYALLTKLDEKQTGKFLAAMPVERASKLSLALAKGTPPAAASTKTTSENTLKNNSQ